MTVLLTRNARRAAASAASAKHRARTRSARSTPPKYAPSPAVANPLRLDPSRTGALRVKAAAEVRLRYDRLRTELYKAVVLEDALGLRAVGNADGANCGIGAGGFLPGNTCARGGGDEGPVPTAKDIQRQTHKVEDVISGKHVVGVRGSGRDMQKARDAGLYTATVRGVEIYAKDSKSAHPLTEYIEGGGKYGTTTFSRLLGYTDEEIRAYARFLKAQGNHDLIIKNAHDVLPVRGVLVGPRGAGDRQRGDPGRHPEAAGAGEGQIRADGVAGDDPGLRRTGSGRGHGRRGDPRDGQERAADVLGAEGFPGRDVRGASGQLAANAFFGTLTDRLTQFGRWLKDAAATLWQGLEETLRGITQLAVRKGAGRAFDEVRSSHFIDPNFRPAARDQFLHGILGRRENQDRFGVLEKRITDESKNHRDSVVEKIERSITDSVGQRKSPQDAWKEISTTIDRERDSAVTTVGDEVVRGHAEGQIAGYNEAGVTELFPLLEWTVHPEASKTGVCPRCRAMKGTVWTVSDARGKIPLHRNCKCSWSARNPDPAAPRRDPSPAPTLYLPGAGAKFQQNAFCPTGPGGGVDPTCSPHGAGAAVTVEDLRPMLPPDADGRLGTKAIGAVTLTGYRVGKADDPHGRGIFFAGDHEGAEQYKSLHAGHDVQEHTIHLTNALLAGHQNDVTRLLFKKSYNEVYSGGVEAVRKADVKVAKELKKRGYDGVIYLKPAPPAKTEIGVFRKSLAENAEPPGDGANCGVGPHGFRHGNTCAKGGHPADHGLSPEAEAYLATAWFNGGGGRKRPEELPAPRRAKLARSYASQVLSAERSGKPGVALELAHAAARILPGAKLLSAAGAVEPHDGGRHEFAPGPPLTGAQLRGTVRVLRPGLTFPAPKNRRLLGGGGGDAVVLRALVEPV